MYQAIIFIVLYSSHLLVVVLIAGHMDVGTFTDDTLQSKQAVEPLAKVYDPCGQGLHGSRPVLE